MKLNLSHILLIVFCVLFYNNTHASQLFSCKEVKIILITSCDSTTLCYDSEKLNHNPNPIQKLIKKRQRLNKKITSAALAFPFPFGIVGLHRIYLGTKPHVPVVYIASLGGVFGVLPLVDFIAIICDKDFEQYKNNGKVFMWIKE